MKGRLWIVPALLGISAASMGATPRRATEGPRFKPVILIDLVSASNDNPVATRVFTFTGNDDDDPLVAELLGMVKPLHSLESSADAYRVLTFMRAHGEHLSAHSSNRWVSHQGDSVEVIVFGADGQVPSVTFEEQARQSRLTADLDSLVETAGSIDQTERGQANGNIAVTRRKYRLRDGRAILKVSAQVEPAEAEEGGKGNKKERSARDKDSDPPVITTIVTGPSERVFLSANAAFSKIRQTKYNVSDGTFQYGNKPTELLIGVNYSIHDVFQNENASGVSAFVQGVYFGFLFEPSKRPFNQIAATMGFRHSPPPFESLFSLAAVSPYIGVVWARDDVPDPSSATHVKTRYGKPALIMGLALGLDKALGWLGTR